MIVAYSTQCLASIELMLKKEKNNLDSVSEG